MFFLTDWSWPPHLACISFFALFLFSNISYQILRLKPMFTIGCELTIHVSSKFSKSWGSKTAKWKQLFLGVDIDFDLTVVLTGDRYIPVPAYVDVAVIPSSFQVDGLQLIDLILNMFDLPLYLILLVQQLLNTCLLLLALALHLNIN